MSAQVKRNMIREGLCREGKVCAGWGPWVPRGQLGPWPWALAPGPPIITSERDQLHGRLLHGRLLHGRLPERHRLMIREGLCRVGPLGP